MTSEQAELLWFSDRRAEAREIDPQILYLDFEEEECRNRWNRVKPQVLESWIRDHPGTRPGAFWKFDATEPRKRTPVAKWGPLVPDYCFGLCVIGEDATYESQADFLRRHGLLDPSEVDRSDFKPEFVGVNDLVRYLRTVDGIVE